MHKITRYDALDGVRTICCSGIVAMHVLTNANYGVDGFAFQRFIPSLTNFVFLFMTISGFGMCCGYYERFINKQIDIVDFYKKRYKKILPFFALLCLLDFAISPSLTALYEVFANLTLCFGLIPNAKITVIGVGWFLGTVFVFYFLFPFFCFLLADKKRAWIGFIASMLMNYLCTNYFQAKRQDIMYSFVFFYAGGIVYLYKDKLKHTLLEQWINFTTIVVLAIGYFVLDCTTIVMIMFNMAVLIYAMGLGEKSILNWKPIKKLGQISFEVYLCHMMVYRFVEKAHLLRLCSNDYINFFTVYMMVLAGAIVFALFGKWLINKMFICIEKRRII